MDVEARRTGSRSGGSTAGDPSGGTESASWREASLYRERKLAGGLGTNLRSNEGQRVQRAVPLPLHDVDPSTTPRSIAPAVADPEACPRHARRGMRTALLLCVALTASIPVSGCDAHEPDDTESPPDESCLLDRPPEGADGVLIDMSHGQSAWGDESMFSTMRGPLAKVTHLLDPRKIYLRAVESACQLTSPEAYQFRGLIFGAPVRRPLESAETDAVARWVQRGGRLLLVDHTCAHSDSAASINRLARQFSLSAAPVPSGDGVVSPCSPRSGGPLLAFRVNKGSREEVLAGIDSVVLRAPTRVIGPPSSGVLLHMEARAADPGETTGSRSGPTPDFWEIEPSTNAAKAPRVAGVFAPDAETGAGDVLLIGSWDIEPTSQKRRTHLLLRLVEWLSSSDDLLPPDASQQ